MNQDTFNKALDACVEYRKQLVKKTNEVARLREALELIATPKRPDGTYNRCREACELLAKKALADASEEHCYICKGEKNTRLFCSRCIPEETHEGVTMEEWHGGFSKIESTQSVPEKTPVCPNCKSDKQVWRDKDWRNEYICHRYGCGKLIIQSPKKPALKGTTIKESSATEPEWRELGDVEVPQIGDEWYSNRDKCWVTCMDSSGEKAGDFKIIRFRTRRPAPEEPKTSAHTDKCIGNVTEPANPTCDNTTHKFSHCDCTQPSEKDTSTETCPSQKDTEWRELGPDEVIQEGDQVQPKHHDRKGAWIWIWSHEIGATPRDQEAMRYRTLRPLPTTNCKQIGSKLVDEPRQKGTVTEKDTKVSVNEPAPEWRELGEDEVIQEGDEFQEKQYDPIKNKWYTIYECSMVGKKVLDSDWGRFRTRRPLPKPTLSRDSYDEDWNLKPKQEEMPLEDEIETLWEHSEHIDSLTGHMAFKALAKSIRYLRDEIQKLKTQTHYHHESYCRKCKEPK